MKTFTSVRKIFFCKKIKRLLLAEIAAFIALLLAVIGANMNYLQVQAAERHVKEFQKEQTAVFTEKADTAITSAQETAEIKAKQDAEAEREKRRTEVVNYASQYQGYNYVLGGREMSQTAGKGLDCAGFVNYVYANSPAAIEWKSMNVTDLYEEIGGSHIPTSEMQKGDIIFFSGKSHIAIYAGNGEIIHAMDPAHGIVKMNLYRSDGKTYSGKEIIDVRRVL